MAGVRADGGKAMSSTTARINTLDEWFAAFLQPTALTELAVLVACVLLAWLVTRLVGNARRAPGTERAGVFIL